MSLRFFHSRAAFTRTELLFFLVALVILAAVGYAPFMSYLEKRSIAHAVENARTISTLLSQYATDNDGVYPIGEGTPVAGKSEGIARNLLANNYTPDPGIFALTSATKYTGHAADFSDFGAQNISWDFTAGATLATGITKGAPDVLPVVYTTGENVTFPAGTGLDVSLSGNGPFAKKGMVVAYKDNSAKFIAAVPSGADAISSGFLSKDFKDGGPYTQIKP